MQGGQHHVLGVEGGQGDHGGRVGQPSERRGGLDAGDPGHPQVHQDHVRAVGLDCGDDLVAVGGLTDHVQPLLLQDPAQQTAHQRVVIHHKDTDHAPMLSVGHPPLSLIHI